MAVGYRGLWITLTQPPGTSPPTSIIRLDLGFDHDATQIPIDSTCSGELVVGAGAVWSWGEADDDRAFLCRIDPRIDRVVSIGQLPEGQPGPMVATDRAVWIAHLVVPRGGVFADAERSILRIDPTTGELVGDPIPLVGGAPARLTGEGCPYAAEGGALWVAGREGESDRGILARLDEETLAIDRSMAVSKDGNWPALAFDFEAGRLWLGREDTVTNIRLP